VDRDHVRLAQPRHHLRLTADRVQKASSTR
jgi:hypothetical protein